MAEQTLVAEYTLDNEESLKDLSWINRPKEVHYNEETGEGMRVLLDAKTDFWQKTYYQPLLVADNGHILVRDIPEENFMVETSFCLEAGRQFDQAGLIVRIDKDHWIKTGLEYVDGHYRLSCVVTNVYSDWSCSPHDSGKLCIRIYKQGVDFVVEAKSVDSETWDFIRICHLDIKPTDTVKMGLLGCAPVAAGGKVTFDRLAYYAIGRYSHSN